MSKNDHAPMLYTTNAQVAALNKVSGFDPLKLLRRTVSPKTGEEVLKLDLGSKKLWFRLACPKGRIRLTPLRITEKLAIYEAQVFLNQDDAEPVSCFTSSFQKAEAPKGQYIQAAQEEAVDHALTDAGFGIQFSDVSTRKEDRRFGTEYPVDQLAEKTLSVKDTPPAAPPEAKQSPVLQQPAANAAKKPEPVISTPEVLSASPKSEQDIAPVSQPKEDPVVSSPAAAPQSGTNHALEILRGGLASVNEENTPAAAEPPETASTGSAVPIAAYTPNMPVEEILKRMTLEQAKAVVVDSGSCRGKTIEEVAARRSASLKFYLSTGYTSPNNAIRAAARIMLDSMKKAG